MKRKFNFLYGVFVIFMICIAIYQPQATFAADTKISAGSDFEDATLVEKQIGYVSSLDTEGETDYFKFVTDSTYGYYNITLTNINLNSGWNETQWLNLYLKTEFSEVLTSVGQNNSSNIRLEPDTTYYLVVCMGKNMKDSLGNYKVRIDFTQDKVLNTKEEANTIEIGKRIYSSFDGKGDSDWFKFTTTDNRLHKIEFKNINIHTGINNKYYPKFYIYDEYNNLILYIENSTGKSKASNVELDEDTTYYIKCEQGTDSGLGEYSFLINDLGKPTTPNIKSLTSNSKNRVVIQWASTPGSEGYEVQYASNSKYTSGKVSSSTPQAKLTIKGLKSGQKYYFRARPYKIDADGKKIYGAWTGSKTIKVK